VHAVGFRIIVVAALLIGIGGGACARAMRKVQTTPEQPATLAELWQEPGPARDLFHGAGGAALAPRPGAFTFVAEDTSGYSPGFDVEDDKKIAWSVKTGPEAQTEVVASRILWAIGFHQPPTYYLEQWWRAYRRAGAGPLPSRSRGPGGRRRLGLARESLRRHARIRRSDRHQPDHDQLGLENVEQQDLRAEHAGERRQPLVRRA
jgi:hypothetical protein